MAYALELLAFYCLIGAQAVGALFACLCPWHHIHRDYTGEQAATSESFVNEAHRAFALR